MRLKNPEFTKGFLLVELILSKALSLLKGLSKDLTVRVGYGRNACTQPRFMQKPKLILVQFRTDQSASCEVDCVRKCLGDQVNLVVLDALDDSIKFEDPENLLKNISGLILGGSGEFSFSSHLGQDSTFDNVLSRIQPLIKFILKNGFPTLGICFGHHILGHALGSEVVGDENQRETGTFEIEVLDSSDPLFVGIPRRFDAQMGHKDSLTVLPSGTKLLARSGRCAVQGFRYGDNIYGVQFHPEMDKEDVIYRLSLYPDYAKDNQVEELKRTLKNTPHASKVLTNFPYFYYNVLHQ